MQNFISSANVISRLLLSKGAGPKVIIISGFHCILYKMQITIHRQRDIQGGSNMTGTDLYVNKPHCAAAVRP